MRRGILTILVLLAAATALRAERIKDIATLKGVRDNPLWGYGLVIGLNGSGDSSKVSQRALANILRRQKIPVTQDDINSKNIASVIVTATLPPFGRKGQKLDVTVSTIGSATSLQGGTLIMTPLIGADGQTYAVAQGQLTVGGFTASGTNASITKGHPTVGRIANGATIEREELSHFVQNGAVTWLLQHADFATANAMTKAINRVYADAATTIDAGTVRVRPPRNAEGAKVLEFVEKINALAVEVDTPAVVVINERTGTVIVGKNVAISTVAISVGNLSIITTEREQVSQPSPFSNTGTTEKTTQTDIKVIEARPGLHIVPRAVTVSELVQAINAMGLSPRELISIFEALKEAGALQATLKVM